MSNQSLVQSVDDLLPQTQCRQCGFDGCRAYATAIVNDQAPINRCAPGGAAGIARLASLLERPILELDPEYGHEVPFAVARIRAEDCIGCAWCTKVCPTAAIAGSPKHLHGVITDDCTGCSLCLAACPMDCIDMVENGRIWTTADAHRARELYRANQTRRQARQDSEKARLDGLRQPQGKKSLLIADIMAKVRQGHPGSKKENHDV